MVWLHGAPAAAARLRWQLRSTTTTRTSCARRRATRCSVGPLELRGLRPVARRLRRTGAAPRVLRPADRGEAGAGARAHDRSRSDTPRARRPPRRTELRRLRQLLGAAAARARPARTTRGRTDTHLSLTRARAVARLADRRRRRATRARARPRAMVGRRRLPRRTRPLRLRARRRPRPRQAAARPPRTAGRGLGDRRAARAVRRMARLASVYMLAGYSRGLLSLDAGRARLAA